MPTFISAKIALPSRSDVQSDWGTLDFLEDGSAPHWGGKNSAQTAFIVQVIDEALEIGLFIFWANFIADQSAHNLADYKLDSASQTPITLTIESLPEKLLNVAEQDMFMIKPVITIAETSSASHGQLTQRFTTLANQVIRVSEGQL